MLEITCSLSYSVIDLSIIYCMICIVIEFLFAGQVKKNDSHRNVEIKIKTT